MTKRLLSRNAALKLAFDARILCEQTASGEWRLVLEQAPLEGDHRVVLQSRTLAGLFPTRQQADEAAVAVLTALSFVGNWVKA